MHRLFVKWDGVLTSAVEAAARRSRGIVERPTVLDAGLNVHIFIPPFTTRWQQSNEKSCQTTNWAGKLMPLQKAAP